MTLIGSGCSGSGCSGSGSGNKSVWDWGTEPNEGELDGPAVALVLLVLSCFVRVLGDLFEGKDAADEVASALSREL